MDITKESQSEGERGMAAMGEPTLDMPTHTVMKPEKFFKELENNFKKDNITCEWKKFCHTLMALDEKTLKNLRGLKAYRPHCFAYKILKMEVITRCKKRGRGLRFNRGQRFPRNVQSVRSQESDINMNCKKNETVTRTHTETTSAASVAETPMEIDDAPVVAAQASADNMRTYRTLEECLDSLKDAMTKEVRQNYAISSACRVNALRASLARISAQAGLVNKLLKRSHEESGEPVDENVTKSLNFISSKSSEVLCKTYTSKALAAIVEGADPSTSAENTGEAPAITPGDDDSEPPAENTGEAAATTSANDNTATGAENTEEASATAPANDDSGPSIDKFIAAMSNDAVRKKARRIFSPKEYYVLLNFLVKQIKKKAHESAKNGTLMEKMQRWHRCLQTVTDPNYDPSIYEFMLKLHEDGTILKLLKPGQKGPEQEVPQPKELENNKDTEEQDVPEPLILEEETE